MGTFYNESMIHWNEMIQSWTPLLRPLQNFKRAPFSHSLESGIFYFYSQWNPWWETTSLFSLILKEGFYFKFNCKLYKFTSPLRPTPYLRLSYKRSGLSQKKILVQISKLCFWEHGLEKRLVFDEGSWSSEVLLPKYDKTVQSNPGLQLLLQFSE